MQLLLVSFCLLCYFSWTCGTAFDDVTGDVTDWLESPANDLNNRDEMVFDAKSRIKNVCRQFCSGKRKTKKCKKLVKKYKKQWKSWASSTCAMCRLSICPKYKPKSFFSWGNDDVTTGDAIALLNSVVNRDTDQSRITQQDFDADSSKRPRKCKKYCKGKRRNKRCSDLVKRCNTSWKNCPAMRTCRNCHLLRCPKQSTPIFETDQQMFKME